MYSLCIVDLHIAVNYITPFSDAMETQQRVPTQSCRATKYFVLLAVIQKVGTEVFKRKAP
jgi:hypothetical protein